MPPYPEFPPLRDTLYRHVNVLTNLIGSRNTWRPEALVSTRTYLRDELEKMGHAVVEETFKVGGRMAVNLEVVLTGTKPRLPELVVGAHYDTANGGTPGADDNGSAVAALLEIARGMSGMQVRRTTRLVFYDCEEMPYFARNEMGSQHHAAVCKREGRKLLGMICLESIGYFRPAKPRRHHWSVTLLKPFRGRHVVAVADFRSALFLTRVQCGLYLGGWWRTIALPLPKSIDYIHLSDHRGYWEQGFRAVMITDTAVLRNPNYHELTDTVDTLDYDLLTKLTRALIRTVRRIAR